MTEFAKMDERDAALMNPLQLAYMGDAVWEMMVRSRLFFRRKNVRHMHTECVAAVNAAAQASFAERIRPSLKETETAVFLRGRNAHPHHPSPRHQDPADYAEATGFEAVLGYLYATGSFERLRELETLIWNEDRAGEEKNGGNRNG